MLPHMMTRHVVLAVMLVGVLFLGTGAGCEPKSADQKAIKSVWERHADANETSNGKAVVALSSKSTFEYYDRLLKLGLDGKPDQIKKLTPFEKAEIVLMRHRSTRAELRKLDGKGYIEYATSKGWYAFGNDPDDPLNHQLGKIKVGGDGASAWAEVFFFDDKGKKRKSDYAIKFFKEGGLWKLDETSVHLMWSHEYTRYAKEFGKSEDEFIVWLEEFWSGQKVPDTIWQPMK